MFVEYIKKYKWFIGLGVVVLYFFITFLTLGINSPDDNNTSPTPTIATSQDLPQENTNNNTEIEGSEEPLEEREGLIRTETLPDGNTTNYYSSTNPDRPDFSIERAEHDIVFQRNVISPEAPINIEDFIYAYGEARFVFLGSNFYGDAAEIHIYADEGIAVVINPATGQVYEQHVFEPMRVEDYVRRFGEDISSNSGL